MGAWSYEVLSNDRALDTMMDLEESKDIKADVIKLLDGYSSIDEKLLAVEIVDISLNGIDEDILGSLYEYEDWFKEIEKTPMNDLLLKAIHTIKYIKKHDGGWVEEVKEQRMELLNTIEKRLMKS